MSHYSLLNYISKIIKYGWFFFFFLRQKQICLYSLENETLLPLGKSNYPLFFFLNVLKYLLKLSRCNPEMRIKFKGSIEFLKNKLPFNSYKKSITKIGFFPFIITKKRWFPCSPKINSLLEIISSKIRSSTDASLELVQTTSLAVTR